MPADPLPVPVYVNHYLCPAGMALPAFLDLVAHHGFCGAGLTQAALDEMPLAAIAKHLKDRGLGLSSLNSAGYFLDPGAEARNRDLLDAAAELGARALNVIVGGAGPLPLREARARCADGLAKLAEDAQARGVTLMLEPLHPNTVRFRSCINSIAQAGALAAGLPATALNLDLFHLWWDPDLDRLCRGGMEPPLALVQVCDVGGEIASGGLPRRVPLDEGGEDWRDLLRRIPAGVPVELELFADQMPGRDIVPILAESAELLGALRR